MCLQQTAAAKRERTGILEYSPFHQCVCVSVCLNSFPMSSRWHAPEWSPFASCVPLPRPRASSFASVGCISPQARKTAFWVVRICPRCCFFCCFSVFSFCFVTSMLRRGPHYTSWQTWRSTRHQIADQSVAFVLLRLAMQFYKPL